MKSSTSLMIIGGLLALFICNHSIADTRSLSISLPDPLPQLKVLTLLLSIHLLGMCLGLGGATMLDFWIIRWMRKGCLPIEAGRLFEFISHAVTIGLCLLWFSGLGLLALYAEESPGKLDNPKLWAKVVVVIVLTINGLMIHSFVLPEALRDMSRPLLHGASLKRAILFLVSGAVSGVSWYTAFAFGVFRELNNKVTFNFLIIMWVTLTVAASLTIVLLWLNRTAAVSKPSSLSPPT
ncbi:hypothetical protein KDX30_08525 [Pseudomonas sp. CDFA 553]|uniref:hypothetical protein n=1 Tax=Pseudomonas quasicaspiana TaxID=2829821 RepID=UPI001E4DAA25|nr:hypothetical protein [Pseudomonas quasicaspiana]MCD5987945.1 hypothetical protein [Pseudomonas quasicaspiana]